MSGVNMNYEGEDNLELMKLAQNYNKSLVALIVKNKPPKAKDILDFGSGDGWFAHEVAASLKQDVICVEPAQNMLKYYEKPPLTSLEQCETQSVDFVYSLNVLEHIEDDARIIDEFYRVLRKNGELLLYLPAFPCLYSSMDKHVGHYRRYKRSDVKRLFDTAKWQVEKINYADFLGWFASLVFKFSGNDSGVPSVRMLKLYDSVFYPISLGLDKLFGKFLGKNIVIRMMKRGEE